MTLWIDDGTEDGFLANCRNCPFAIETAADWADYNCAYDPPVFAKAPPTVEHTAGEPVWMQPLLMAEMHCHNHPMVQWTVDFGRGWQKGIRRPGDAAGDPAEWYRGLLRPEDRTV